MHKRLNIVMLVVVMMTCTATAFEIRIRPDIKDAIDKDMPVIALESTIICHGMPYPKNIETALEVEETIRRGGGIGATIAIIKGDIVVGITRDEMEYLVKQGHNVQKVTRQNFATTLATKCDGATTVAGTMMVAHMVGIKLFVTGGIGGVSRGGEMSMDVSADLLELAQTPVVVISAGIKSILDIPRTLEVLETHGVPVIGYNTSNVPAFFSRSSGCPATINAPDAEVAARIMQQHFDLGIKSGMLVGVPVPEKDEANAQDAIDKALVEAEQKHMLGNRLTPFVLSRVNELTGGASLNTNMALVGVSIAVAWAKLRHHDDHASGVLVFGSVAIDVISNTEVQPVTDSSIPGETVFAVGGVGHNIALASARVGTPTALVAPRGRDAIGDVLYEMLKRERVSAPSLSLDEVYTVDDDRTATYVASLVRGSLNYAIADMNIVEHSMSTSVIENALKRSNPRVVMFDANLTPKSMSDVVRIASNQGCFIMYEPTSVSKAARIVQSGALSKLSCLKPNAEEALVLLDAITSDKIKMRTREFMEKICSVWDDGACHVAEAALALMERGPKSIIVTLGKHGALLGYKSINSSVSARSSDDLNADLTDNIMYELSMIMKAYEPHVSWLRRKDMGADAWSSVISKIAAVAPLSYDVTNSSISLNIGDQHVYTLEYFGTHHVDVVDVTGAGDTLVGVYGACVAEHGDDYATMKKCLRAGMTGSEMTLQVHGAVSPSLNKRIIEKQFH